jgi:hypothetical protein
MCRNSISKVCNDLGMEKRRALSNQFDDEFACQATPKVNAKNIIN